MGIFLALALIGAAIIFDVGNYCSSDAILIAGAIIIAGALASND